MLFLSLTAVFAVFVLSNADPTPNTKDGGPIAELPDNWDQTKDDTQSLFLNKNDKNDLEPYPLALSEEGNAEGFEHTGELDNLIMRPELYGEPPAMEGLSSGYESRRRKRGSGKVGGAGAATKVATKSGSGKKNLKKGTDVQQVDHLGRNALHLAVCSGNLKAIKLLLDAGVKPNVKDNVGMTPLSLSLMRRPSLLVANMLFDHGAQILPRTNPMDTGLFIQFAMMCTPTSEEENILKLLVEKGAVINDSNAPGGRQALHFAAMSNNTTLIGLLVSLGADLNMINHRNETPKDTAETFKCQKAYELLCELEENEEFTSSTLQQYK